MNCESMDELLSAYVDGELNREEKIIVEVHLQECPVCRIMVHDFQNTSKIFYDTFSALHAPQAFEQLIAQNISAYRHDIQVHRLSLLYLASGVFGLLVILSLSLSPVGHFMRASIRLTMAIFHGAINLMSVVGNVWFAMIGILMLIVLGFSITQIVRLFQKIQNEAIS